VKKCLPKDINGLADSSYRRENVLIKQTRSVIVEGW